LADYGQAIRLDPKNAEAHNARAWLLATRPDDKLRDGKLALNSARRLCELSDWKDASYIDTLAAAYAEVGDFEKASQHQRQAIELATPELRAPLQDRLELYQDKKPYREVLAGVPTIAE
jgi:Flp pilus assembly protein TadD